MVQSMAASDTYPMDKLLAKLSEHQPVLTHKNEPLKTADEDASAETYQKNLDHASSSSSLPITPATDTFLATAPATRPANTALDDARPEADEVLRLKLQLAQAQNQVSKLDQELAKSRSTKADPDLQGLAMTRNLPSISREATWPTVDDAQSDSSETLSATAFNRARGIWGNAKGAFNSNALPAALNESSPGNWGAGRGFHQGFVDSAAPYPNAVECFRGDRLAADHDLLMRPSGGRRSNRYDNRLGTTQQFGAGFGAMGGGPVNPFEPMGGPVPSGAMNVAPGLGSMGMSAYPPYQQPPVGTTLSPHASEFTSKAGWKNDVSRHRARPSRVLADMLPGRVRRRADLPSCHGASQLSPTLGQERERQLEVNCRQDCLQQRPASLHFSPAEAQGGKPRAKVRGCRGHCGASVSFDG